MKRCLFCGTEAKDIDNFCAHCGKQLQHFDGTEKQPKPEGRSAKCPRCDKEYANDFPKCPFCGSKNPGAFPGIRHFFTKVVGESYKNKDGERRQEIIKGIADEREEGKLFIEKFGRDAIQLLLDAEEDNPVDPNAIKVRTESGVQLGYLNRKLAADVAARNAKGYRYLTFLDDFTGSSMEDDMMGVNMLIIEAEPEAEKFLQVFFDEYFKPRAANPRG
ncbi:MAG: hypothetical protein H6Q04_1722 [Acidobacteria bacterium]|nr:hypothetical protein [Acidobacteriota bacterium]